MRPPLAPVVLIAVIMLATAPGTTAAQSFSTSWSTSMGRLITYSDLNSDGDSELLVEDPEAVRIRILDPVTGNSLYQFPVAYSQYWDQSSAGSPINLETLIDEFDGTPFPEIVAIHRPGAGGQGLNTIVGIIGWNGSAYVEQWRLSLPPETVAEVSTGRFAPGVQHLVIDDTIDNLGGFVVRRPSDGAVEYNWRVDHPNATLRSREIGDFDGDGLQEILVSTEEDIPTLTRRLHLVKWSASLGVPGEGAFSSRLLLGQNAPNPFTRETEIAFEAPHRDQAMVRVFDTAGRLVRSLLDGTVDAGRRRLTWDGRDQSGHRVAIGTYFYQVTFAGERQTKKMVRLE